jgi:hypothetical protein
MAFFKTFVPRLVEESNLDVQLQLRKCDASNEQLSKSIAKIEKELAQVLASMNRWKECSLLNLSV